jgi:tetratricopeptide (TPR) repeat protein
MRTLAFIPVFAALLASPAFAWMCPAKGGLEWREYRTEHFVIDTDLSRFKVEGLVKSLETTRRLVLQGLFNEEVDLPGRIRVVVPSSPADFTELAGSWMVAGHFRMSQGDSMIVMPMVGSRASDEVMAHELAHLLSHHQFPEQSTWFAEGIATFLETVAIREEQRPDSQSQFGHIVRGASTAGASVGVMPSHFMEVFGENQQIVPARELLEWRGREIAGSPARYHLSSWLLYHWLWNKRSNQFVAYQKRLADGDGPDAAWKTAFPEYDPSRPETLASLDQELSRYGKSARYTFYKVKSAAVSSKYTEAPLSSADVHMLRLHARLASPEQGEGFVRAELDEALREDSRNPEALTWRARLDGKAPDVEQLRGVANGRKTDFRAWLALAEWTRNDMERRLAYQKAVELNPESAPAQAGAAMTLTSQGQAKEALAFANRALDLEPWNPGMVEALAAAAHGLGRCEEALQLERRAVRMIARGGDVESKSAASKRLVEFEKGCKPSAR